MTALVLDGSSLTLADLEDVARHGREVVLANACREPIDASRALVERIVEEGRVVYGITTGFGSFAEVVVPHDRLSELQLRLEEAEGRLRARGITAPCDGHVVEIPFLCGDIVAAFSPVVVIEEESADYVDAFVPEKSTGELRPGQRVAVHWNRAEPGREPGRELPESVGDMAADGQV